MNDATTKSLVLLTRSVELAETTKRMLSAAGQHVEAEQVEQDILDYKAAIEILSKSPC